jgi:8-oxo-dGTP diphosphatase
MTKPSLYFVGANPTADLALFRPSPGGPEVLLIKRSERSEACPRLAAFPGGFVESHTSSGAHSPAETPEQAAWRELAEETGLARAAGVELISCGSWDAPWRDPRNSPERFAQSHLFCAWVPEGFGPEPKGLDDAEEGQTQWTALGELTGRVLAFDHGAMLSACCAKLGIPDPGAKSWAQERLWAKLDARRTAPGAHEQDGVAKTLQPLASP